MSSSAFFAELTIDTSNYDITIEGTASGMGVGDKYIYSPGGSSAVDGLVDAINVYATPTVSASVSSDGYLTLTSDGADVAITGFDLYEAFGFSANNFSITSGGITGTYPMKYTWTVSKAPIGSSSPVDQQGSIKPVGSQVQTVDSTTYTTILGALKSQNMTFKFLTKEETWTIGDDTNNAQYLYETCYDGRKVLYVPGWEGSGGSYSYHEYVINIVDDVFLPTRLTPTDLLWELTLKFRGV